jgi:hypothetical protein
LIKEVLAVKVKKDQLKKKIGVIVSLDRNIPGENYVIAYLWGLAPIKIKTKLTQVEFDRLCGERIL